MYNVELPGILKHQKILARKFKLEHFAGPPSCLALFYNDGGENGDEVLYGTEDGKIGLLQLTRYVVML